MEDKKQYVVLGFPHIDIDGVGADIIEASDPTEAARQRGAFILEEEECGDCTLCDDHPGSGFESCGGGAGVYRFEAGQKERCRWTLVVIEPR